MRINRNHILALFAVALAVACALSVYSPIRFDRQKAVREQAVKERLVRIRYAEELYRKVEGRYTDNFDTLINRGFLADSLQYIPFAEGKKFSLSTSVIIGKSGRETPLMECGAEYADYMSGLDGNSIANLTDAALSSGRYPGLKIGDLSTPNDNAGNWE